MRLSQTAIVSKRKKSQIRAKQKHKRLDAICETAYTQNRVKVESPKSSEVNGDVRRSSRVRRAPLVLDASPAPPKKRRKIGELGEGDCVGLKTESPLVGEESGEWKSRLRARGRKVSFVTGNSSPRSKKKLFDHSNGVNEQLDMVVQSKRPGRIKASSVVSNGDVSLDNSGEDGDDTTAEQVVEDNNNKGFLLEDGVTDNVDVGELLEQGKEVPSSVDSDDIAENTVQSVEQSMPGEQAESGGKENHSSHQDVTLLCGDHVGDCTTNANHMQDENSNKVGENKYSPAHRYHKSRIKKGRWCGLCGGGTDGKPPKRQTDDDGAGSDNVAYSGSSSAEEPTYDIWDGFGDEPGWLGQLLGPINDRFGIAGIWVHQQCAVWSPEVYFAGLGCLKNVRSALFRGKGLKCSRCGGQGATIGCRVDRCPKTYHLPCARAIGCIFDHRKFLIACTDHRRLFQPHGSKYLDRLKKLKAKKTKLELRKQSNDAWRKDHEAEEKWLENCGEDEEFLKRESKRLHRDLSRITPVYIGGPSSENQMPYEGWESVGGLQDVIQSLKEVVILPLLYPEFFNNMGLTPPRGVLLHGYPGTGKTLVVRSLIGSCARGDKRIAYFARKGADCLGKYVGDAERQLRLLFQVAEKSQPSIIFFDEIDGLAPSRTRQQDQTHNSVVSTLLALLDGLKSRGSVIVIGATNRPDAIDPALRRPGRFDREIYFPLPSVKDREAILSLHTQKWPTPVNGPLLKLIAGKTVGFAGADLQALCTQTAIIALKRGCNWEKLLKSAEEKGCAGKRPVLPTFLVQERDWLEALSSAPPPCSRREAGMAANDIVSAPLPFHLFPCMLQSLSRLLVSLYLDDRVSLPPSLSKAAATIKTVIVSTLDRKRENSACWWSQVQNLLNEADVASDMESNLLRANVLAGSGTFSGLDAFNDDTDDSKVQNGFMQKNLVYGVSNSLGKKPGFCLLISGSPRSGQRHLASCILHSFVGNVVLHKVDLATMLHEGAGDMVQGLTQILLRCASVGSCMLFMPRIDLWALETCHQVTDDEKESSQKSFIHSNNRGKSQDSIVRASDLWSSFVEQAESIFISASLTILATSEVPLELLSPRITDFFGRNKQNPSPSNHTGSSVPRFCIHLDGNFNRDMVIGSSATKLSNDVARYFVELIHHKTHTHESLFKDNESFDMNTLHPNLESDSAVAYMSKSQTPFPTTKREEKGKSNLLLAISTFGYQILQYPHFAELCWVTSKLKEGPSTEIDGPWKVWPFNSCIVRPNDVKSEEKCGLVHGLVAVGLSAYRGLYSSLRDVSADVRKVLEILTSQINAKVESGKDKYQFVRLLSQVAYLDDMVNSWAYALQSLEAPPQQMEAITKLDENAIVQVDDCMDKPSHSESVKENTEHVDVVDEPDRLSIPSHSEFIKENTEHVAVVDEPDRLSIPSHSEFIKENTKHVAVVDEPDRLLQTQRSSSFKDQTDNPLENGQNGIVLERSELKSSEHCNGFVCEESVPADEASRASPSGVCLYRFCSKCLFNLKSVMQRLVVSQWDAKSSNWTTEDVDDAVTSLSLNLYTTVQEFCLSDDIMTVFEGRSCECEVSGNKGIECGCHSESDISGGGGSTTGHGVDSELIYKNGVAAAVPETETETDVCYDCKFQKLCLCSLIEYIVMTKQPSG